MPAPEHSGWPISRPLTQFPDVTWRPRKTDQRDIVRMTTPGTWHAYHPHGRDAVCGAHASKATSKNHPHRRPPLGTGCIKCLKALLAPVLTRGRQMRSKRLEGLAHTLEPIDA